MKTLLVPLVVLSLHSLAWGKEVTYVSPDNLLRARVHTDSHGESRVQFEDIRSGRALLARDDTSRDGSHGYGVVHGAWTADSQFFVAGLESSGGHQPWAHPIWVFSGASNRVVELAALGITVISDFRLRPPDILETQALEAGAGRTARHSLSVRLHTLLASSR